MLKTLKPFSISMVMVFDALKEHCAFFAQLLL